MSDSDVVIVGDDPAPPRKRARKRVPAIELLDDDSDDYEPTPVKGRKRKITKQPTQPAAESNEDETPARKKGPRKQTKAAPEKRTDAAGKTVRFSAQPSQKIYDRIQRALPGSPHRMFLISTKEVAPAGAPGARAQEFAVLGATGNVYDVTISRHPHCTCPDHAKGNLCKHILFVMLRVLKLDRNNPLVWQKALLTKEVEEVLAGKHSQGVDLAGVLADDRVRRAYSAAAGEGSEDAAAGSSGRRPVEGDCPICFDELKEGSSEALVWCKACGNNIHKACFDHWADTKRSNHHPVTCVYCRAPWQTEGAAAEGISPGGMQYLNLAQHSAAHARAATSLEALYGENAHWINHHQHGHGSRAGAARMWRQGYGY